MSYSSGYLTLLISKLRANPNLDTCTLNHVPLKVEGFLHLFGWLTKGDDKKLPDQVFDDEAGLLVDKQTFRPEDATPESDDWLRGGFPRSLRSLELNTVGMNDLGFEALIKWLLCLREKAEVEGGSEEDRLSQLHLHSNDIQGTSRIAESFISALSFPSLNGHRSSSLSSLILSNNPLSAEFKQTFFTLLPVLPSLQHLHLSFTGLTKVDAGFLASYIDHADRDCKLVDLRANANDMGYWGVRKVVNALRRCWTIEKVELFANGRDVSDDHDEDDKDTDDEMRHSVPSYIPPQGAITSMAAGSGTGWEDLDENLKNTLARNIYLKRRVIKQALKLLRYCRPLLWQNSTPHPDISTVEPLYSKDLECSPRPQPTTQDDPSSRNLHTTISFMDLPTEIQLSVLSHLAPSLSTSQKLRIFEYASDKTTLPTLRLCLPSSQSLPPRRQSNGIPDPLILGLELAPNDIRKRGKKTGSLSRPSSNSRSTLSLGCSGGSCIETKATKVRREAERQRWLTKMGCNSYDPGAPNT